MNFILRNSPMRYESDRIPRLRRLKKHNQAEERLPISNLIDPHHDPVTDLDPIPFSLRSRFILGRRDIASWMRCISHWMETQFPMRLIDRIVSPSMMTYPIASGIRKLFLMSVSEPERDSRGGVPSMRQDALYGQPLRPSVFRPFLNPFHALVQT